MPRSSALLRLIEIIVVVGALWGVDVGTVDGHSRDESVWPRSVGSSPAIEKIASTSSGARLSECLPCASLRAEKIVERWAWQHFPDSFAGIYKRGDDLVVGFTERQGKRVRAARELRGVSPNVKVLPFPYVPGHPLAELGDLERRVWHLAQHDDSIRRRLVGVGIDEQANLVDVGASRGQVKALARLLRAHFGQNAPIHVHYEEAPVEV